MPPLPPPTIARPRLLARLVDARVAFLVAGAGYGKSTLAGQAAAAAGVATVTLDLGGVGGGAAPVLGALRRGVRAGGLGALDAALAVVTEEAPDDAIATNATDAVRQE